MRHYKTIRAHPVYTTATIYYVFENNMGREADHLKVLVDQGGFTNAIVLSEHRQIVGFYTDSNKKIDMFELLADKITCGLLAIATNFITTNPDPNRQSASIISRLFQEMENLKDYLITKGLFERRVITGVLDSKLNVISGMHDDIVMALAMLLWAAAMLFLGRLPVDPMRIMHMYENQPIQSLTTAPIQAPVQTQVQAPIQVDPDSSNPFSRKRMIHTDRLDLTTKKTRFE